MTEKTRTLADGTQIVERTPVSQMFRDAEGRRRFSSFLATGPDEDPIELDVIRDYVAGREYLLDMMHHTAHRMNFDARAARGDCPAPLPENRFAPAKVAGTTVRRSLGSKKIEDDMSDGTLTITTIPAGAAGNDKAFAIEDELWISRALGMRIFEKRSDPREGTTVTQVTHILHRDPAPDLFALPKDFVLLDETKAFSIAFERPSYSSEERAVRAVIRQFIDARNMRDGKAAASAYAADGEYHGTAAAGLVRGGENLAQLWGNMGDQMIRTVNSVSFLTPNVAMARVDARFESGYGIENHGEMFLVVKADAGWKIRVHEGYLPLP